jgi:hypothetical protein
MRTILTVVWALALLLLSPITASAQACDGAPPTSFFVLPATGASFAFSYPTTDHDAGVVSYTLTLSRQANGTALTTQTVTKAATTVVGPVSGAPTLTCYAIPVVPLASIPKGVPLVATLKANAGSTELSSDAGPPTAPFGSRLSDPALRPKP